jgi:hypothetical protein
VGQGGGGPARRLDALSGAYSLRAGALFFFVPLEDCFAVIKQKTIIQLEGKMINLLCGRDPVELGIKTYEGWNITAFLDHLSSCDKCSKSQEALIDKLNQIIGSKD